MKCFVPGIYSHRGSMIRRDFGGWTVDCDLKVYKRLEDARNSIDKYLDGTHKAEPVIIRELSCYDFDEISCRA